MADVKIRVMSEDRASDELKQIDQTLQKTQKSLDEAKGGTKGFSLAFTELNSALALADRGFQLAGAVIDATVNKWADYATAVRETSDAIGWNYAETSRAIQVADDFGIEMGTVRQALQLATKNGMEPGIEGLAQIADRFASTTDTTERAAEMNRIFGRNWSALVPILKDGGAALRENAAAISDSMIITEEAAQKALEYKQAMDNLQDVATGLQYTLGGKLAPVLTVNLGLLSKIADQATKTGPTFKTTLEALREFGQERVQYHAKEAEEAAAATREYAEATSHAAYTSQAYLQTLTELDPSLGAVNTTIDSTTRSTYNAEYSMQLYQRAMRDSALASDELKRAQGELATAEDEWQQAAKDWSNTVGGDIVSAMQKAKMKTDEQRQAMDLIDQALGTNFGKQADYQQAIQDLVKGFDPSKPEEFKNKIADVRAKFAELSEPLQESINKIGAIEEKIRKLEQKHVQIWIDYIESGQPKTARGQSSTGRQSGGPVGAGYPFMLNENPATRPETLVSSYGGEVLTRQEMAEAMRGARGVTYSNTFNIQSSDPEGVAYAVANILNQQAAAADRSGASLYAGQ